MASRPTGDHSNQANSEYFPWPVATSIMRDLHTDPIFLQDLLREIDKFDKFLNLDGLRGQLSELLEYPDGCTATKLGCDALQGGEVYASSGSNRSLNAMTELGNCDFILLEEWIQRMNRVTDMWIKIRAKMEKRAKSSRSKLKQRLSLLDCETRWSSLDSFPPGVDLSFSDRVDASSSYSDDYLPESKLEPESKPETKSESESLPSVSEPHNNFGSDFPSPSYLRVEGEFPIPDNRIPLGVPLHNLPTEIWHEVILKARESDLHIQFTLSQVNHFFRTLVTNSPLLWSKLDLMCPLSVASFYLERSVNTVLDVVADQGLLVDPSPRVAAKDATRATAFYKLLRPHRHRVRYLKVRAPRSHSWAPENQNAAPTQEGLTELPDHFLWSSMLRNLEYLELAFGTWEDLDHSQWPVLTRLRELRLYGRWTFSVTALVSPFLKHITLGDHPRLALKVVRDILLSTPALESLTFSDVILDQEIASNDVVILSLLTSLSVVRSSSRTIKPILETIVCPKLHDLCLNFTGVSWDSHALYRTFGDIDLTRFQLFSTPLPQIRRLDLVSCEANPSFLEITLNYLPGLNQLRIASACLTDHHLRVLAVKTLINGDVCKCPQLSSLTIENEPLIGSNIVRYVVQSRSEASFPLRSVTLRGVDREKIFWEDLQCIRACGVVDLNVTTFGKDEAPDDDDSESSGEWSTDQGSEFELLSGDEDVIAR